MATTASRDEMIAAKHDFDRYNGEMNAYLDCLKLEMDASPKDLTKMTPDEKKKADQEQKVWCRRTTPPSMNCRRWLENSTNS